MFSAASNTSLSVRGFAECRFYLRKRLFYGEDVLDAVGLTVPQGGEQIGAGGGRVELGFEAGADGDGSGGDHRAGSAVAKLHGDAAVLLGHPAGDMELAVLLLGLYGGADAAVGRLKMPEAGGVARVRAREADALFGVVAENVGGVGCQIDLVFAAAHIADAPILGVPFRGGRVQLDLYAVLYFLAGNIEHCTA